MFMILFYIFIAAYLILRGGREAGFWASNPRVEGFLMLAAGAVMLLAQLL